MTATHPAITQALAYAVNEHGCTKQEAISQVIAALVETGIELRVAYDAVLGKGAYQATAAATWELLQAA